MKKTYVFPDRLSLSAAVANHVAALAEQAIAARGRFTVALSGGSLPKLVFPPFIAATVQTAWTAWHVCFADERCVPLEHADSNYLLVRQHLLDHVPIPPAQIYTINPALDPVIMAETYQQQFQTLFAEATTFPQFDLILLGMGPDGHTASLFPGHALLHERQKWVAAILDSPKPPSARITLTLPVINQARQVIFVAAGESKVQPLQQIAQQPDSLPAGLVQPINGDLHWYVDEAAKSGP